MFKRKLLPLYLLIFLSFLSYFLYDSFSNKFQPKQTHEIVLSENGFSPAEIEIHPGDSIKFSTKLNESFWPASDLHPTHGIYPEFDPQEPIDSDKSWIFKFFKTGKWRYHDHLNPIFRGTITVR